MSAIRQMTMMMIMAGSIGAAVAAEPYLLNQCFECHGKIGTPGRLGANAIGGMPKDEIINKLKAYRSQQLPDSVMARGTHDLTDSEIESVAEYFSQVKTKSK